MSWYHADSPGFETVEERTEYYKHLHELSLNRRRSSKESSEFAGNQQKACGSMPAGSPPERNTPADQ
eukprot:CAMPEP_0195507836 /NCGR_PEP_ID=MMETSP0794_2-20130614/1205_1 /TAXON_ID=515487 /ORGANISM="Stephanopyxis turris, Strain CCMP 815" /LENGTH=66 /DNA_ID=CAMNT_0040634647 /DNA_START=190 /DNA_END=390 /DNA_ORIENTATION=-